jgi:predicted enzyme related to lactoylglutathione lyase
MGSVTSRFAVLCVDCVDPEPLARFWCDVLQWGVVDQDETGVSIGPANNAEPRIDFMAVPEVKVGKNRLHIDLRADGCTTAEELDRLLALGACRVDVGQGPDVTWVVLADPEGNEFCLLAQTIQQLAAEER